MLRFAKAYHGGIGMADEARRLAPGPGWIPGWTSLRSVTPSALPREIAAGVSVAAVAIPVGLAYAALMGIPPVYGLYASIFPMVAYALFGPSRYLIVGPDTATCLLAASALTALGMQGAEQRTEGAAALALVAGVGFALAGVARLGFIANLLSRPILVGYLGGVALTLLISQIGSFTGMKVEAPGLVRPMVEIVRRSAEIHWLTLGLAVGLFAALQLLKHLTPRLPGPAIVVAGAIVLSWWLDLQAHGVAVIGAIPSGLPAPRIPEVSGKLADLGLSALGLLFVSFASGMLTARSFGEKLGVSGDANLELRGFAAANIVAGLLHGFAVTGADSRTAVNLASGGRTPVAPIAAALVLMVVLTALTAPLTLLPQAALGAVLASAALGLVDVRAFVRLARIGRQELVFALVAMAGVIWVGVLQGVFLAIAVTFIHLLGIVAWPRNARLGSLPDRPNLVSMDRHPDARPPDGGVAFNFEASLLFVNADFFRERALAALAATPGARWFVLDASAMPYADSTAVEALETLRRHLDGLGVRFVIATPHGRVREVIGRAGLIDALGAGAVFPSVEAALAALQPDAVRKSGSR